MVVALQGVGAAAEAAEGATWVGALGALAARSRTVAMGAQAGPRKGSLRPWTRGPITREEDTGTSARPHGAPDSTAIPWPSATGTTLLRVRTGARRTGVGSWRRRCSRPAVAAERPRCPPTLPPSCSCSRRCRAARRPLWRRHPPQPPLSSSSS
ncbi:unnamed protein product, partial [Ixodes hexagonus]